MGATAQGAIEYLLIIGVAILVVSVVVVALTGITGSAKLTTPNISTDIFSSLKNQATPNTNNPGMATALMAFTPNIPYCTSYKSSDNTSPTTTIVLTKTCSDPSDSQTCTLSSKVYIDSCAGDTATQYSCANDSFASQTVLCTNGCTQGVCE